MGGKQGKRETLKLWRNQGMGETKVWEKPCKREAPKFEREQGKGEIPKESKITKVHSCMGYQGTRAINE